MTRDEFLSRSLDLSTGLPRALREFGEDDEGRSLVFASMLIFVFATLDSQLTRDEIAASSRSVELSGLRFVRNTFAHSFSGDLTEVFPDTRGGAESFIATSSPPYAAIKNDRIVLTGDLELFRTLCFETLDEHGRLP